MKSTEIPKKRRRQKTVSPEMLERCRAAGIGVERDYIVAQKLGVSRQRVSILRQVIGLPDPRATLRQRRKAALQKLLTGPNAVTQRAAAQALGIAPSTVTGLLAGFKPARASKSK